AHEWMVEIIRYRLGLLRREAPAPPEKPTPARLAEVRKQFVEHRHPLLPLVEEEAFYQLTIHDPKPVADYLIRGKVPDRPTARDPVYEGASLFAHLCGKERSRHLRSLLGAQEPLVRVAGAVYLCFEDREEGMAALHELTKLEGDAGAWAALTLARRGQ